MKISLSFDEVRRIVANHLRVEHEISVNEASGVADTVTHGQYDDTTTEFVGISFDLTIGAERGKS